MTEAPPHPGRPGFLVAITRAVSPTLGSCELTHLARQPIDVGCAITQHAAYESALHGLGAEVVRAGPAPELPDAVFVEDTAIVLDEIAVITRPGAPSRLAEIAGVAEVLGRYRRLIHLTPPVTLDGGDVLRVGRTLYVGLSSRTSREAAARLADLVGAWDYNVIPVSVNGCLHLKSAITQVGEGLLLANPHRVQARDFAPHEILPVHEDEPDAGNALRLNGSLVFPEHHPRTARRLGDAGLRVVSVPCTEIAKAEGGVTCCSLILESKAA